MMPLRAPSFGAPTGGAGPMSPARSSSGYLANQPSGVGLAAGPTRSAGSLTRPIPPQPTAIAGGSPTGGPLSQGSGLGDLIASGPGPHRPGVDLTCQAQVSSMKAFSSL